MVSRRCLFYSYATRAVLLWLTHRSQDNDAKLKATIAAYKSALVGGGLPAAIVDTITTCAKAKTNAAGAAANLCTLAATKAIVAPICAVTCASNMASNGGLMSIGGGRVTGTSLRFSGGKSISGGAVYIGQGASSFVCTDCSFRGSSATNVSVLWFARLCCCC